MFSVLIPVYNFDIRALTKELRKQLEKEKVSYEIILLDDESDEKFKILNREISGLKNVLYAEEKVNIGRSRIRNKLAGLAKYSYLLFLDCDSGIPASNFISNYLNTAKRHPVINGGRVYQNQSPAAELFALHWLYGKKREQNSAKNRNHSPNKSFQTNNFLITKDLFDKIKFNEEIIGYGHEDTLFGYELAKRNINILHIDNPVIHLGLESNEVFLKKTREGVKNLVRIKRLNRNEKRLIKDIALLDYYKHVEQLKLTHLIEILYKRNEHRLRRNLLSKHPNLILFDLYKLGYLCSLNTDFRK